MAIIRQYHKDTDTTYVYESKSYWDPELKQARSKRHCIGKIDPETGEVVPTGRRGKKKKEDKAPSGDYGELLNRYEAAEKENTRLHARIQVLEEQLEEKEKQLLGYQETAEKIADLVSKMALS